jgi:PleD family two-component response regulator
MELSTIGEFLSQSVRGGTVPAAPPPAPRKSTSESNPALVPAALREKKTVLVVDDQQAQLEAARGPLERAGYEVLTLDNPLMLARTLRRNPVDVVILEPELKTMKGAVVVQTLRTHGLMIPIFLWSSADDATLSQRVRECQAAGSIRKGDLAALIRGVGKILKS